MSDNINDLYKLVKPDRLFKKYTTIAIPYQPYVTKQNYEDGFMVRYFARHVPSINNNITEIDEKNFKVLKQNPLYQLIDVKWKIRGRLYDFIVNASCCNNKPIVIIEQTGNRYTVTPEEFNNISKKIEDKIIADGYIIGYGIQTENRKTVEFVDLTMPGMIRYIKNYTEFWQGV